MFSVINTDFCSSCILNHNFIAPGFLMLFFCNIKAQAIHIFLNFYFILCPAYVKARGR